ncbi:MAG: amidase family protein, partial [Pseudomonadota bacterium]
MKHLLAGVALGLLCGACSSVADVSATADADVEVVMPERVTDLILQTLPDIAAALEAGEVSSEELVTAYLIRIEEIDRSGPSLQSVLAVNPNALEDAVESDARRAMGKSWGPLDGVPILLKDNIESLDP